MNISILWHRLAGGIDNYVRDYTLQFSTLGLLSENKVDYTIPNIEKLFDDTSIEGYWVFKIAACRNINDLPEHLKELVVQYLPCFFEQYPQYKDVDCLKVK